MTANTEIASNIFFNQLKEKSFEAFIIYVENYGYLRYFSGNCGAIANQTTINHIDLKFYNKILLQEWLENKIRNNTYIYFYLDGTGGHELGPFKTDTLIFTVKKLLSTIVDE